MAFIPCNNGSGATKHTQSITLTSTSQVDLGEEHEYRYVTEKAHSTTYTLSTGSSVATSQDMGTHHEYRYAKWPYTSIKVTGTLYAYVITHNSTTGGDYGQWWNQTKTFTITINTKAKTYTLSGDTTDTQTSQSLSNYSVCGKAYAKIAITSVTFT